MSVLLRAYAVLQGGGVKGAALAGAVAAAEGRGIAFDGFGGASAGAIVAALFAFGYRGDDIRSLLLGRAHPRRLLDDEGTETKLSALVEVYTDFRNTFGSGVGLFEILRFWYRNRNAIGRLRQLRNNGLYPGVTFVTTLQEILKESPIGRQLQGQELTFEALKEAGAPTLRIIAANLSTGEAKIFDAEHTPKVAVVNAVRASMSFPLVFEPYPHEGHRLADGGLASNLPVFLFRTDHIRTGHPIIGIDLREPERAAREAYDFVTYLDDLASCALEASDRIFRDLIAGVDVITIRFERRIGTLRFELSDDDITSMFHWGASAANRFLNQYPRLQLAVQSRDDQVRYLQAQFGPPKIVMPICWGVKRALEERTSAADVRVSVMLPLPIAGGTSWVRCYQFPKGPRDHRVELGPEKRGIAECVNAYAPVVINYEGSVGPLSDPQLKCAIFFPIGPPDHEVRQARRHPVRAVLQIETTTKLGESQWATISHDSPTKTDPDPVEPNTIGDVPQNIGATWAAILYALTTHHDEMVRLLPVKDSPQ